MTKTEVMRELKANGTAQNRKIYKNHGATGKMFGVSYAFLGKLKRKIKTDQELAEKLWETGNHDARALATMIADPQAIKVGTLNAWVRDAESRHMAAAVSNVAGESPHGRKLAEKWTTARREMTGCAGWHTLASVARWEDGPPDRWFEQQLKTIEAKVHASDNWVRYAMNNALINIGVRNAKLEKKAVAAAKRIGKIEVDHGATSCKTPDAASYIKKTLAHRKKKAKR